MISDEYIRICKLYPSFDPHLSCESVNVKVVVDAHYYLRSGFHV